MTACCPGCAVTLRPIVGAETTTQPRHAAAEAGTGVTNAIEPALTAKRPLIRKRATLFDERADSVTPFLRLISSVA